VPHLQLGPHEHAAPHVQFLFPEGQLPPCPHAQLAPQVQLTHWHFGLEAFPAPPVPHEQEGPHLQLGPQEQLARPQPFPTCWRKYQAENASAPPATMAETMVLADMSFAIIIRT